LTWTPEASIKAELHPGENLRWVGSPSFRALLFSQLYGIAFGLVFAAVSGRTLFNGTAKGLGFYIVCLFALIGVATSVGAAWPVLAVGRMAYAVTDRRLLIVRDFLWRKVIAVAPTGINIVEHRARANGSGSVTFRRDVEDRDSEGSTVTKLAFLGVRDVANAVREITRLRDAAQ
jgi:hypothetical protein